MNDAVDARLKLAIAFLVAAVALAFGLACVRAIVRSRRLQRQYRLANPEERAALDARALTEPELAEYMLPLRWWQTVPAIVTVAGLVAAKFAGVI